MKTNRIIAGMLVVLGFGSVLGLTSGCGANRASKSRTVKSSPAEDGAVQPVYSPDTMRIMVMYGVPVVPFEFKQVPESGGEGTNSPTGGDGR